MIVSDIFVEKIVNTFLDKIANWIGKRKNKKKLKNEIRKCFDRYFKEQYQNIPPSEEFDVHKLHEFLSKNLETRVLSFRHFIYIIFPAFRD